MVSLVAQMVKASAYNAGDLGLISGWEDPWRRKWQPTPLLLPGKSHGQRDLEVDRDTVRPLAVSLVGPGSWVDWDQLGGHVGNVGRERNEGF